MKKNWIILAASAAVAVGSLLAGGGSAAAAAPFSDVNGHWAEAQILSLTSQGVISGINNHTFAPDRPLTRGQFVVMLAKILKNDLKTTGYRHEVKNYFTDVKASDYYADELVRLCKANIIDNRGSFRGGRNITRQEMAHYLVNAYRYLYKQDLSSHINTSRIPFKDAKDIAPGYRADVVIADKINLISGRDNGKFDPRATLTRGEAAYVIYRFGQIVPYEDVGVRSGSRLTTIQDAYYKNGNLYITFTYDLPSAGYNGQIIVVTRSGQQINIDVDQVKLDDSSSVSGFKQTRTIVVKESNIKTIIVRVNGREITRFNV
ncbi:S-layer homology domain-containing protein [Aneurinibacillus thermoaerophilus]|uniref:S-layer homology domain-containing protein n=1 Tax=Aneurinibacillus thermoaerophilus TaxID=143495 RepID=UPI002E1FC202|nr:S-layer homology domain-containing protein [Aneurinibacillus thermoaerophilus]MED0764322.1 S-layer homology domain-containing protein [Aneurinibacillus thermoaerophilus]